MSQSPASPRRCPPGRSLALSPKGPCIRAQASCSSTRAPLISPDPLFPGTDALATRASLSLPWSTKPSELSLFQCPTFPPWLLTYIRHRLLTGPQQHSLQPCARLWRIILSAPQIMATGQGPWSLSLEGHPCPLQSSRRPGCWRSVPACSWPAPAQPPRRCSRIWGTPATWLLPAPFQPPPWSPCRVPEPPSRSHLAGAIYLPTQAQPLSALACKDVILEVSRE